MTLINNSSSEMIIGKFDELLKIDDFEAILKDINNNQEINSTYQKNLNPLRFSAKKNIKKLYNSFLA